MPISSSGSRMQACRELSPARTQPAVGGPGAGQVLFLLGTLLDENFIPAVDNPDIHHHDILPVGERFPAHKGLAGAVAVDVIDVADLFGL